MPVLVAIDLGSASRRLLWHAAGFARLLSVPLRVLHVHADTSVQYRRRVADFCAQKGPFEVDVSEDDIDLRSGEVAVAICEEANKANAALLVIGSHGRTGLAKLLMGSTSEAVLRETAVPVLLVPPGDIDIVNITDRVALTTGPVLVAVDLAETPGRPMRLASELAQLGHQSLLVMTVAPDHITDHDAGVRLHESVHGLAPAKPHALIVRRGNLPEEISRCAVGEGAGLVVLGLRGRPRRRPGTIATAVVHTNRAFVLAVPTDS